MNRAALGAFLICVVMHASAQTLVVQPFLQDAEPGRMTIAWESSSGDSSHVDWGTTSVLGFTATGTAEQGLANTRIHHVHIDGLSPDTRYYYRVRTGAAVSDTFDFITPPLKNSEKNFRLVAMSDMQRDNGNPNVFRDICEQGVIPWVAENAGPDLPAEVAFMMIPGDLVDYGPDYPQWKNTFFTPSEKLLRHIPLYPVTGNHEANTPYYFKYFDLPQNGSTGYLEHWWYKDYSNVRIIGLDSNTGYRLATQLSWLENVLFEAAADPDIDFVIAQLHHPHHSELWVEGNLDYTGEVIKLLENFSTGSGKPSLHFFGHTHAYSRGHSQDHRHVMVNVATAGGNIDHWGEYLQQDYPEYVVSQDDYGFTVMSVTSGNDPSFTLQRISRGNEQQVLNNVQRDSFTIRRYNERPSTPTGLTPVAGSIFSPGCPVAFTATSFQDTDGDMQHAAQWQVATTTDFATPVINKWEQYQNWYNNEDRQANNLLTDETITGLPDNAALYWRVRYRDQNLLWSEWSTPIPFFTSAPSISDNLLANGGAESGEIAPWVIVTGQFEALVSAECGSHNAHTGTHLFSAGGVCTDTPYGEGAQDIDLAGFAAPIDEGAATAVIGGYLRNWQGSDLPQFRVAFSDESGNVLYTSEALGQPDPDWILNRYFVPIPPLTASARFTLMGTRQSGSDNDSYFDDMFFYVDTVSCSNISAVQHIGDATYRIRLQPNPVSDQLNVTIHPAPEQFTFKIFNAVGHEMTTGYSSDGYTRIPVDAWPAGMYYIQFSGANLQKTLPFSIQR